MMIWMVNVAKLNEAQLNALKKVLFKLLEDSNTDSFEATVHKLEKNKDGTKLDIECFSEHGYYFRFTSSLNFMETQVKRLESDRRLLPPPIQTLEEWLLPRADYYEIKQKIKADHGRFFYVHLFGRHFVIPWEDLPHEMFTTVNPN